MVIWKFSASLAWPVNHDLSGRSLWISHITSGTMKLKTMPDKCVISASVRSSVPPFPAAGGGAGGGGGGVTDSGGTLMGLPLRWTRGRLSAAAPRLSSARGHAEATFFHGREARIIHMYLRRPVPIR